MKLSHEKRAALLGSTVPNDIELMTMVPTAALEQIRLRGLLSGDELARPENRHLLDLARPDGDADRWLDDRKRKLKEEPWSLSYQGPSTFFGAPDEGKLHDKHPLRRFATTPVRIRLSQIMRDFPDTKVHGTELEPYSVIKAIKDADWERMPKSEQDAMINRRHRDLNMDEVRELIINAQNPQEFWKHHDNPEGKFYANDVPHAQLVVPGGRIDPKYLNFGDVMVPEIEKSAAMNLNVFTDRQAYATTILVVLIDHFGTEVLSWDPESIRLNVKETFRTEIEDSNMDRLMAAIMLLTTDGFYKNLNQFIATCNALSGATVNPDIFDPATVVECAWGITEATLLNPDFHKFSAEINKYVGARLMHEGWSKVPTIFKGAVLPVPESTAEDFSDDPDFFAGVWGAIRENERLLDETMSINKGELLHQLSLLKIKNGSYKNLVQSLERSQKKG